MNKLYPIRFKPVYKDYLWGGTRIPERFGRDEPEGIYAESWEISTHPDGESEIANGPLAGQRLRAVLAETSREMLGTNVAGDDFPLLIKLIDARDHLSVQVHPNEANAEAAGGDPKTEMWYFLEGDPGASVYCGLNPGIGKKEFLAAMESKTLANTLRNVPAVPGEAVFVPGGRVHAIGAGCLLLEVQQRSNTTYRLHDWDRVGTDGKPRELHIEKALSVIAWNDKANPLCTPQPFTENGIEASEIKQSDYFKLDRLELSGPTTFEPDESTFHALFLPDGAATLKWPDGETELACGQSWLIPAALKQYELIPKEPLTLLRITVPGETG